MTINSEPMTDHPITPPLELVQQWFLSAKAMPVDQWVTDVATAAARWGADQELEACCEWLDSKGSPNASRLRTARRPPTIPETIEVGGHTYRLVE